ncbi:MAG TPA: hypothetical protein VIT68_04640 [Candidatus Gracilibacteria bacterium]
MVEVLPFASELSQSPDRVSDLDIDHVIEDEPHLKALIERGDIAQAIKQVAAAFHYYLMETILANPQINVDVVLDEKHGQQKEQALAAQFVKQVKRVLNGSRILEFKPAIPSRASAFGVSSAKVA